jgi:REP element-mobilizing transposase RayT
MVRGARRAPIFRNVKHNELFLALLSELPARFGVAIHGYALMPNHVHLMLESRRGCLSRAMSYLLSRYTVRVNAMHEWDGPLFKGRFHNRLVYRDEHWLHLLAYIHLNPVRARLVMKPAQATWTSHRFYAGSEAPPPWLETTELAEMFTPLGGYERYLAEVRSNRGEAPDGFDVVVFEAGRTMSDETERPPPRPRDSRLVRPSTLLAALCRRAGVSRASLRETRYGRIGNPARIAAAFLLVIRSGLKHREVGALLAMREVDVTKAITKVRAERDTESPLDRIVRALLSEKIEIKSGK